MNIATKKDDFGIDAIDRRIIGLLRRDGRMSHLALAEALDITVTTLRSRLRRLESSHTLRVVAVTDYRAAGFDLIASTGVIVKGRAVAEVAADLAALPQVPNVHIMADVPEIEISVIAHDRAELSTLLNETLLQIPGVHRLDAGVALTVSKLQWGWVPFLLEEKIALPARLPADKFDALDDRLLDLLTHDARTSNRELARQLNVTEGTIRIRIKRLLDDGVIRITAISSAHRLGHPVTAMLWIDVDAGAQLKPVAKTLAANPQIYYVATMLGRCDVLAITLVESAEQLADFIHREIDPVAGVNRVRYTLSTQYLKHDYHWTLILPKS